MRACVLQGHVYRSKTREFERWHNPEWLSLAYMPTQPANLDAIHDSLVSSVVKRVMSDAPLGVLLSGGLDSSLVASIAVKCVPLPFGSFESKPACFWQVYMCCVELFSP